MPYLVKRNRSSFGVVAVGMAIDPDQDFFVPEEPLLLSGPTSGPIEVEITNPRSVVWLGVMRPDDNAVRIGYTPTRDTDAARAFHAVLAAAEDANSPVFVLDGNRLTVTLPDVPEGAEDAGVQLHLPAGSTVNYSSHSGKLRYDGSWNPRDDWWVTKPAVPAPPLDLTYRADNGSVNISYATGSVDVFDRAGSISLHLNGGIGTARTTTGSLKVNGTGTLSIHAEEPGSTAHLEPPCDLDLTVHPGAGEARYGMLYDSGIPLDPGTYHATADYVTKSPSDWDPQHGPLLWVTPAGSARSEAPSTASAALTGPAESGRAAGEPVAKTPATGGRGAAVTDTQVKRAEGGKKI